MFIFGVILLASYACAASLPPCTKTGTGLETPPLPSNCHQPHIVAQKVPQILEQSSCQCAEDKKQVCGSDGKTYPNNCSLNCAKAKNLALKKDHDGQCTIVPQKVPQLSNTSPCQCTEDKKPVCGTDGKTYSNQCSLNCQQAKNPALKKEHDGPCTIESQKVPQLPKQSPWPCAATKGVKPSRHNCACPKNHQIVCGSDGHTYNECELKCVSNDKPGLTKIHDGPCKVPQTGVKS